MRRYPLFAISGFYLVLTVVLFCVIIVVVVRRIFIMEDKVVLVELVMMYLMDGRSDAWVSRRLGISEDFVREVRVSEVYRRRLREREELVRSGVEGSLGLFRELVRGLMDVGGMDVGMRLRLFEVMVRYCGFGRYVGGVLGGGIEELGVGGSVDMSSVVSMEGVVDGR